MSDDADVLPVDETRVRRNFSRARMQVADDFLQREVAGRLLDRLATVRVDAARVADLGCGAGRDREALGTRFEGATVYGVDAVGTRLAPASGTPGASMRASMFTRFLRRDGGPSFVQADFAALPFRAQSLDVLWSNLALHWSPAPHRVLAEWSRVLRTGGLVAFSAFGPDTLREVAEAFGSIDARRHVHPFTDMHDYGDMLVAAGLATPVVDMERLVLTYSDTASLWRDVRALGGLALNDRHRGLRSRRYGARVDAALEQGRDADGRLRLTFELIYAHAWKGEPRTTSRGETIVRVERKR